MRFKEYITETWYYHGTSTKAAKEILKNGFNKSLHNGKIFLTRNYMEANKYSKISNGGIVGVVLKIHKNHLNTTNIVNDHSGIIQYKGHINPKHISKA